MTIDTSEKSPEALIVADMTRKRPRRRRGPGGEATKPFSFGSRRGAYFAFADLC